MKLLGYQKVVNQIWAEGDDSFTINLFCKLLYGYLLIKLIFIFPVTNELVGFFPIKIDSALGHFLYAPLLIFQTSDYFFFGMFLLILFAGLLLKINYIAAFIIFWFSFSLSRLTLPINNGSDSVLNLFLLIAIWLPASPGLFNSKWHARISRAALLLAQISLALIYFISGYDKLMSQAWRSGAAFHSIMNLTFHAHPLIHLELSEFQFLIISWLIILFELGFSILIWFNKFRVLLLALGVLFHLGIVFFLGLVDFGMVMILCYAVFLPTQTAKLRHEVSLKS